MKKNQDLAGNQTWDLLNTIQMVLPLKHWARADRSKPTIVAWARRLVVTFKSEDSFRLVAGLGGVTIYKHVGWSGTWFYGGLEYL